MKEEAQLVALLEWMGWKVRWSEANDAYVGTPPDYWDNPLKKLSKEWRIPPLTLDLMHEAEDKLTDDQYRTFHYNLVQLHNESCMPVCRCHSAKADKRAEAFLRALGKWQDE